MKGINSILSVSLILYGFLLIAGCNDTFEPLQENDKYHFSIYGTLDAAADTQWVRVGSLRRGINETPDQEGIEVILEHIQTGKTISMNDSLFSHKNFLNYWTTHDIENEQTYRITVERDGKESHVTVTTPREMPVPPILTSADFVSREKISTVYINDTVEHLADVQSKWYVLLQPDGERRKVTYTFYHRNTAKHTDAFGGSYFVDIFIQAIENTIRQQNTGTDIDIVYRQVFVAAGGQEWDDNISSVQDLEYFLNETTSNVENGLGYVVGVDSKWVTMDTCYSPGGAVIACEGEEPFWK